MTEEITLTEYQSLTISGLSPTEADQSLAQDRELRKRLRLDWLADGNLKIRATSYVGVVELDCARVRVVPKLAGDELNVLRMVDYTDRLNSLPSLDLLRSLPVEGLHLRDLVCQLLTVECENLLARGPRRDYVRREEALPAVRGRLLPDRQVLRQFGRLDRLECRFEEFDSDILDNRLCASGLAVAARTADDAGVRARARRVAADFAALSPPARLDPREVRPRLDYHRHNSHYRAAHHWALSLLGRGGFADLYSSDIGRGRVFLVDMNTLFERFITQLLRERAKNSGITAHGQYRNRRVIRDEATGRCYTEVRPDVLLTRSAGSDAWQLPVDIKYKLYADRRISQGDLYQLFLYASALSSGTTPAAACALYPTTADTPPVGLSVRHVDGSPLARIRTVAVNLPALLENLDDTAGHDLLAVLGAVP